MPQEYTDDADELIGKALENQNHQADQPTPQLRQAPEFRGEMDTRRPSNAGSTMKDLAEQMAYNTIHGEKQKPKRR